jgi:hypothetical protein
MKLFNITAQVFDTCGNNPSQSILYNEVIKNKNECLAKKQFEFELLIDDIFIQKILSVEEISQVSS